MDNKLKYFKSILTRKTLKYIVGKQQAIVLPYRDLDDFIKRNTGHFDYSITQSYVDEWNRVFRTGRDLSKIRVPYTYYWPTTIQSFVHALMPGTGVVMKNVFHIGHESEIIDRDFCAPGTEITVDNIPLDFVPWEPNKAVVVSETHIRNRKDGRLIYRARDYTCCMGMKPEDYVLMRKLGMGRTALPFIQGGFRKRPAKFTEPQKDEPTYFLDNMLDHRFGLASGGYTLTHGIRVLAHYFRGEDPFIQGTCTANIVIMLLTLYKKERLDNYRVYFNNRLYFPGRVSLRCDDEDFELIDEKGTVVAFGCRNTAAKEQADRDENIA